LLAERRPNETPTDGAHLAKALDAQAALLPYALGVFAVSLPMFVWVGSFAVNRVWMTATFALFAINWGAFYAAVNWFRDEASQNLKPPRPGASALRRALGADRGPDLGLRRGSRPSERAPC
jgi:hypothetical protein